MNCGNAKFSDGVSRCLRYVVAIPIAVTLAVFCVLLAAPSTALGQTPASVFDFAPEEIGGVQTSTVTGSVIQAPPLLASQELISIAPQDVVIESFGSASFVDSQVATFQRQPRTANGVTQRIRLRKNVLGCKGCYDVPPHDEIWIVSVRACSCDPENVDLFEVKKFANNSWQSSSLNALSDAHQNDHSRSTMIYIHGNQTDYEYGVARGFQFYDNLFLECQRPRAPVRLVLWIWQSEREVIRLFDDYIVKSQRAVAMGKTLTKTLEAMGDRRIALVGFSLGSQVVLSALEQIEPPSGCPIAAQQNDKFNVALIAPATDPDYFCSVIGRNVRSSIVRSSTVIVNSKDRVVKAMRLVIRKRCPEARQGFTKLAHCQRFPLGQPEFFDISEESCGQHSVEKYTKSPTAQRAVNAVLNRTAAEPF